MNFLDDEQFKEILNLAIDKKVEELAKPMIQSKLDREIRIIIDNSFNGDKVQSIINKIDKYLYKRVNEEIEEEKLTERIDLDYITDEIVDRVSEKVFKNLRVSLMKK